MNENSTIKDLESQARNTKRLMDKLNRAAYGMTFDEALRLLKNRFPFNGSKISAATLARSLSEVSQ